MGIDKKMGGGNFGVEPGKGSQAHEVIVGKDAGVVSGETAGGQESRKERQHEALRKLRDAYAADGVISGLFDAIDDADPTDRLEKLLDALLEMRRALEASDAPAEVKRARGNLLSRLMNDLRELI